MTPHIENQFNEFGCGCRCLIKLAEYHGRGLTREQFFQRFPPSYHPVWNVRYGITMTSCLVDLAREMGLCERADTKADFTFVRKKFEENQTCGIIVVTERLITGDGKIDVSYHCRLLVDFDSEGKLLLWSSFQDGTDSVLSVSESDLLKELPHYILFY